MSIKKIKEKLHNGIHNIKKYIEKTLTCTGHGKQPHRVDRSLIAALSELLKSSLTMPKRLEQEGKEGLNSFTRGEVYTSKQCNLHETENVCVCECE